MAETAYLQLPRADSPAHWLLVDALGNRIGRVQRGTLQEAAEQLRGRRLVALVPGEHVALYRADIPSRNTQKVLQAAPFALEDRLAEEVDALHFAAGERQAGGYLIAVVARRCMQDWQAQLASVQLTPAQLVPDMAALPSREGELQVLLDDGYALARTPDGGGFTAEADLAPGLVRKQLRMGGAAAVRHIAVHAATAEACEAFKTGLNGTSAAIGTQVSSDAPLSVLAAGLHGRHGLDLQQGEFKLSGSAEEQWRLWRAPAVLLAGCLVLGLAQQIVNYVHLKREATGLDTQVEETFTQAMPGSRNQPGSELVRMQQRLSQLQGGMSGAALLPMLDALGGALNNNPGVQVTTLDYHNGSLQAQLQAGNATSLDALKSALSQQATYTVKLDSVTVAGSQAQGRLILQGANPP